MNYKINQEAALIAAVEDAVDGKEVFGLFSQAKAQLVMTLQARQKGLKQVIKNVRGMKEKDAFGPEGR